MRPKDLGLDYSRWRPEVETLARDGWRFISRYSAGAGNADKNTQWKLCGANEIGDAVAVGLDVFANSEWYTSRVEEGSSAGRQDGEADLTFWKSRGYNRGAVIIVSWDSAPVQSKWGAVDAYLKAYTAELGGYYRVGCYAGTPYLRHALSEGVIQVGWRPNAYSWSGDGLPYQPHNPKQYYHQALDATPAHLWQTGNYRYGTNSDENMLLRIPCFSHLSAAKSGGGDQGDEDVPTLVTVRNSGKVKLKAGTVVRIRWDIEAGDSGGVFFGKGQPGKHESGERLNLPSGPFMSTVQLTVDGLPPGKSVFTALGWCRADDGSDVGRAQWQEHPGNGGPLFVVDTRISHIGNGRAVKLMVKANADASINAHGQWRVAYWK